MKNIKKIALATLIAAACSGIAQAQTTYTFVMKSNLIAKANVNVNTENGEGDGDNVGPGGSENINNNNNGPGPDADAEADGEDAKGGVSWEKFVDSHAGVYESNNFEEITISGLDVTMIPNYPYPAFFPDRLNINNTSVTNLGGIADPGLKFGRITIERNNNLTSLNGLNISVAREITISNNNSLTNEDINNLFSGISRISHVELVGDSITNLNGFSSAGKAHILTVVSNNLTDISGISGVSSGIFNISLGAYNKLPASSFICKTNKAHFNLENKPGFAKKEDICE